MSEITQIKPKIGPDVDVLIKGWDPESAALFVTANVNGKTLTEPLAGPTFYSNKSG